jgi:hypothetical protein
MSVVGRSRIRVALVGAAALILISTGLAAAAPPATFTQPIRLGFPKGDDWEPAIAADRDNHVYVLWSHYVDFGGTGGGEPDPTCPTCASPHSVLQISSDGGATFSAPFAPFPSSTRQDDPQIVVDAGDGKTVYAAYMQDDHSSEYVARSDDYGQHWTTMLVEPLSRGMDKDILAARDGHVYVVFHTQEKIFASVSHDGGRHWKFVNILGTTNSEFGVSLPSGGAIDSRGNAFFAWNGVNKPGQAKGTKNLFVTRSTDGGSTWTSVLIDVSQPAPQCDCAGWDYWGPQMAIAVDGQDRLYAVWNANRVKNAPTRTYFASSKDVGAHWTAPVDVSPAPAGSHNLFPAIAATGKGDLRIAWMDDRNGFDAGGDDPNARWNTYYRSSTNGGASWSAEAQLSAFVANYAYKLAAPKDGYLQPYGDYMELDITGSGKTVAVWGEGTSYLGPGNIWFARQP